MRNPAFPALRLIAVSLLAAASPWLGAPAFAQKRDVLVSADGSHEVVQQVPSKGTSELDDALKRLAADPRDTAALLQAGDASLQLNDVDAATGFYTRAQALGSAEAKAGLAAAQVRRKKPVEALQLFDEAQRAGMPPGSHASDHGLAYDLVGDNARAQELYRLALQRQPDDDETIRRLALSQAIGGDEIGSERTLLPLLQHRDLAAYRTRAFALAASGKPDEAVSIAEARMPPALAGRIAPYLRYMPRLTRAQQAAAANFGHFPEANAIGHDDPRIAAYSAQRRPVTLADASDRRLVPTGTPLGAADKRTPVAAVGKQPAARAGDTRYAATATPVSASVSARPVQTAPAAPAAYTPPAAPRVATADAPAPHPSVSIASTPQPTQASPVRFDLPASSPPKTGAIEVAQAAERDRGSLSVNESRPTVQARPGPPPPPSLEQAFAEFEKVDSKTAPAPGAVDVRALKPALEAVAKPTPPKPAKAAKPEKPKNPSRVWVQVATGGNRKALGHDWDRITDKAAKQFRGKKGYLVDWGRTNRLVTGPFADEDKAQDFVSELKKAGISTFMFTSDDGEEVTPLGGK